MDIRRLKLFLAVVDYVTMTPTALLGRPSVHDAGAV
jgi:hypothetical protein